MRHTPVAALLWLGLLLATACSRSALDLSVPRTDAGPSTAWDGSVPDAGMHGPLDAGPDSGTPIVTDSGPIVVDAGRVDAGPLICPSPRAEAPDSILLPRWKSALGSGSLYGAPLDMALGADDDVYVVGTAFDAIATGGPDAFVARLDRNGIVIWNHRYGDGGVQSATSVATDAAGNAIVAGYFSSSIDFGGDDDGDAGVSTVLTAGITSLFVAKLDPNGDAIWSRVVATGEGVGDGGSTPNLAVDASGRIALISNYWSSANNWHGFVQMLDADGQELWNHSYLGAWTSAVTTDAERSVIIAGNFYRESIDLSNDDDTADAGVGDVLNNSPQGHDLWLLKLDQNGGYVWSKAFIAIEAAEQSFATDIALDPESQEIYLGGTYDGARAANDRSNTRDGFIAKLSNTAEPIWSRRFGGDDGQIVGRFAADAHGVTLTGSYEGYLTMTSTVGPSLAGPLVLLGLAAHPQFFAARLNDDGNAVWAGKLGGALTEYGVALAANPANNRVLLAGLEGSTLGRLAPTSTAGPVGATGVYESPMIVMEVDSAEPTQVMAAPSVDTSAKSVGWHADLKSTTELPALYGAYLRISIDHPAMLYGLGCVTHAPVVDAGVSGPSNADPNVLLGLYANTWTGSETRPGELLAQVIVHDGPEGGRLEAETDRCIPLAPGYYWIAVVTRVPRSFASTTPGGAAVAYAGGGDVDNTEPLASFPINAHFGPGQALSVYALLN